MIRLTRAQVREIDRRSIEEYHIPGILLMENAARSAANAAMEMCKKQESVIVVCGGGNNGGDGFAIARHLHNAGWYVEMVDVSEKPHTGDALINWRIIEAIGIGIGTSQKLISVLGAREPSLIIDAIFGTGLTSCPRDYQRNILAAINNAGLPILAIDLPSGLDCDTGLPLGPECIRATRTITFVAEKAGFGNPESKRYTGEISVGDIGCPRELIVKIAAGGGL